MTLPSPLFRRLVFWFVLIVTLAFPIVNGWFIRSIASNDLPVADEWDLLAEWELANHVPAWYFRHHNEHRYPLVKLLWIGSLKATNFSFLAPMFVTQVLLLAAALFFQRIAAAQRGFTSVVDLGFPALFLHWGHVSNALMGYQLGFALIPFSIAGWLFAVHKNQTLLALPFLAILCTTGGFGLLMTPLILLWCCGVAWQQRNSNWKVWIVGLFALATLAYAVWCGFTMPKSLPLDGRDRSLFFGSLFAVTILPTIGFAPWIYEASYGTWIMSSCWAVGLLGATCWWVLLRQLSTPVRRPLNFALGVALLGLGCVAVGIAYSRNGAFAQRYGLIGAITLAIFWLVLGELLRQRTPRLLSSVVTITLIVLVYVANRQQAGMWYEFQRDVQVEMKKDILIEQLPPFRFGPRYGHAHGVSVGDRLQDIVVYLKRAGVPLFVRMADDPVFKVERILQAEGTSRDRFLFDVPDSKECYLRMRIRYDNVQSGYGAVLAYTTRIRAVDGKECNSELGWRPSETFVLGPFAGPDQVFVLVVPNQVVSLELAEWLLVSAGTP
jgi:hypothetical protein